MRKTISLATATRPWRANGTATAPRRGFYAIFAATLGPRPGETSLSWPGCNEIGRSRVEAAMRMTAVRRDDAELLGEATLP
jgi:hypothetical protein